MAITYMRPNPSIIILGLDPEKHQIPPVLLHHLAKMGKDFQIRFVTREDLDEKVSADQRGLLNTGVNLRQLLDDVGYVPVPKPEKKLIVTEEQVIKSIKSSLVDQHGKII